MQGVLHTDPIEHVALGTTTAPSVLEQAAHVAEVLRQAAVGATELPLFLKPVQVVLKPEAPEIHARPHTIKPCDRATQRAAHVDDGARGLAAHLVEIA